MIFESIHSGPKAIQELVIKIEVKNSGKRYLVRANTLRGIDES